MWRGGATNCTRRYENVGRGGGRGGSLPLCTKHTGVFAEVVPERQRMADHLATVILVQTDLQVFLYLLCGKGMEWIGKNGEDKERNESATNRSHGGMEHNTVQHIIPKLRPSRATSPWRRSRSALPRADSRYLSPVVAEGEMVVAPPDRWGRAMRVFLGGRRGASCKRRGGGVETVESSVKTVRTVETVETHVESSNGRRPAVTTFYMSFYSFDGFDGFDTQ